MLKYENQRTYNYGKREFLRFCRDPQNNVFLSFETIENLDFHEMKIKDYNDFPNITNKILTNLNHPTVFDTNNDMVMILQSMYKDHQKADITIFYKGICIQNILDWNKDIFTIITEKKRM